MKQRVINLIIFMVSFLLGVLLTFWAEKKYRKPYPKPETVIQIDTIRDTVLIDSPIPYAVRVVDSIFCPVYVPVAEGVDTVWMGLPKEQKFYKDSTYLAWVSGYDANLDSIRVIRNNVYTTITNTVEVPLKKKRNYIELDAKFMYDKAPFAPITLNVGYSKGIFDVYAGGGYDLIQKSPLVQVGIRGSIRFD